ncbi:hypothetical protein EVAR_103969_1 [Eumeta japonica]|uniref:Uncharacterized protein n=1 Tax=Eumeta variegata TaxID=151549 RepID=A0A4C1YGX4_EUMVA|nr:hypothetical protein EVAR_103969_1 [Eumeta japonica]
MISICICVSVHSRPRRIIAARYPFPSHWCVGKTVVHSTHALSAPFLSFVRTHPLSVGVNVDAVYQERSASRRVKVRSSRLIIRSRNGRRCTAGKRFNYAGELKHTGPPRAPRRERPSGTWIHKRHMCAHQIRQFDYPHIGRRRSKDRAKNEQRPLTAKFGVNKVAEPRVPHAAPAPAPAPARRLRPGDYELREQYFIGGADAAVAPDSRRHLRRRKLPPILSATSARLEKKMAELGAIYEELVQPARTLVTAARTVQRRRRTADGLKAHKRIQILRYGDTYATPQ